jgi:hypothetical protein
LKRRKLASFNNIFTSETSFSSKLCGKRVASDINFLKKMRQIKLQVL